MADVEREQRDHVVVLTLNRPEVRNAMTPDMYGELAAMLDEAGADLEVRAVILTGAGDAFCSGADTRRMRDEEGVFEPGSPPSTRHGYLHGVQRLTRAFQRCEVPIIAAVNGPAMGLGFDVAIQCDVRIAAERATFVESFVTVGLIPGDGGFWYLPRIIGYSRAVELTVTGRRIDAATALDWGLVSQVVADEATISAAMGLAAEIAQRSPHAVRLSKRLIRAALDTSLETALELGALAQASLTGSDDQREALAALQQRRPGNFSAR